MSALDKQVEGKHYKRFAIQPIEFTVANDLDFMQGNVIKYTCRHKFKNGRADIEKAIHYLELMLDLQYPEELDHIIVEGVVGFGDVEGVTS